MSLKIDIHGKECEKQWYVQLGKLGKIPFLTWQVYANNEDDARKMAYKDRIENGYSTRYKKMPHNPEDILTETKVIFLGEWKDNEFIFSEDAKKPTEDLFL